MHSRRRASHITLIAILWLSLHGLQNDVVANEQSPCSVMTTAASNSFTLAIDADGKPWAWGRNYDGALGIGISWLILSPFPVATIDHVVAVSAGRFHSLAVTADGRAWAWGSNHYGELGDGTFTDASSPRIVNGLQNVVLVVAGNGVSMALDQSGTLWAWGNNDQGMLGAGLVDPALSTPQPVEGPGGIGLLTDVIDMAAGGDGHFQAVRSDGSVWGWGQNSWGQLGIGTPTVGTVLLRSPRQVLGPGGSGFLEHAVSIVAGTGFSTALLADGTLWSWGRGWLGTGKFETSSTPVQVVISGTAKPLTGVTQISAGLSHTFALSQNGDAWSWGWNWDGQLGNGKLSDYVGAPERINGPNGEGTLHNVAQISAGFGHGLAVTKDGATWAWGFASAGEGYLGNGTSESSTTPLLVFEACGCRSCQDLRTTIETSSIRNDGIRTSLLAKVDAACGALEQGKPDVADRILRALRNTLDAQSGQALEGSTVSEITNCVDGFVSRVFP